MQSILLSDELNKTSDKSKLIMKKNLTAKILTNNDLLFDSSKINNEDYYEKLYSNFKHLNRNINRKSFDQTELKEKSIAKNNSSLILPKILFKENNKNQSKNIIDNNENKDINSIIKIRNQNLKYSSLKTNKKITFNNLVTIHNTSPQIKFTADNCIKDIKNDLDLHLRRKSANLLIPKHKTSSQLNYKEKGEDNKNKETKVYLIENRNIQRNNVNKQIKLNIHAEEKMFKKDFKILKKRQSFLCCF